MSAQDLISVIFCEFSEVAGLKKSHYEFYIHSLFTWMEKISAENSPGCCETTCEARECKVPYLNPHFLWKKCHSFKFHLKRENLIQH